MHQQHRNVKELKMNTTSSHDEKIAKMTFASVYPHYVTKVERKGRTKEELHQVIQWLTGYDEQKLQELIDQKATFEAFFQEATLHPNAKLIRSEEHTSELQSRENLVCRLLLEKKNKI